MQPRGDTFDHSGFADNRITFDGPEDRTPGRTLDGHNGFGGYSAYQTIGFNSFNQTNTGQESGVVTTHREGFIRETSFVRFGSEDPQAKREHNGEAQLKQEEISGDEADDLLFRIRDEKDFLTQKNKRIKTQRDRKEKLKIDELEAIDFPSTNRELRIHVKRLVDAIKNTNDILDKPCKNGKPAQAAQRLDRGYYPDEDVELLAWETLVSKPSFGIPYSSSSSQFDEAHLLVLHTLVQFAEPFVPLTHSTVWPSRCSTWCHPRRRVPRLQVRILRFLQESI